MTMETETNNNLTSSHDVNNHINMTASSMLTLRIVMHGKEAGSIIGKRGDNVKKFREESGARINISDVSCPERIVTVTGTTTQIVDAATRICRRFEQDLQNSSQSSVITRQIVTLRLAIAACQCGSLIGKGGNKIKEIREMAGASIQISSEMLPNSTERLVTLSGSVEAVIRGIYHICQVLQECPAKAASIPYRPVPATSCPTSSNTVPVQQQQQQVVQYVIAQPPPQLTSVPTVNAIHAATHQPSLAPPSGALMQYRQALSTPQGVISGQPISPYTPPLTFIAPTYSAAYLPHGLLQCAATLPSPTAIHELTIPNDQIGCIIGRAGCKINEIRQLSGATIKISGAEEGCSNRTVTITGQLDCIRMAEYLITASLELHRSLTTGHVDSTVVSSMTSLPALPDPSTSSPATAVVSQPAAVPHTAPVNRLPVPIPGVPVPGNMVAFTGPVAFSQTIPPPQVPPSATSAGFSSAAVHYQAPIPYSFQLVRTPVLPMFNYLDSRSSLSTKIKGGVNLATASAGRNGNKYSPY